jgi:peroxin-6
MADNIHRFTLHPSLSLNRVSQSLPFTYTGADMYALCSDAMLKAVTRQARAIDEKVSTYNSTHETAISIAYFFDHLATETDTAVMVTEQDFIEAHRELVPSVSADELRHYQRVRATFEGSGKKEDNNNTKNVKQITNGGGKGKGKAKPDEDDMVVSMEAMGINGSGAGGSGKGKGKAMAGHASKNSVDIAEGGFGDAEAGDEDLYS